MTGYFADISDFSKTDDYLPIVSAVLGTDLLIIFLMNQGLIRSKVLKQWYKLFGLSAILADVLIVVLGIILARFLYSFLFSSFSLWLFIGLVVGIQIIHDVLFYVFFSSIPRGWNKVIDIFKDYAKEVGIYAIVGDSLMVIMSCVGASTLATVSMNLNIIRFIFILYLVPYTLYEKG
jgi:hypothetical protein